MYRVYLIFIFLLALVIGASESKSAEQNLNCASLFTTNTIDDSSIADLIAPNRIKRLLYQQSQSDQNLSSFISEYLDLLDSSFMERFVEITYKRNYSNLWQSGFHTPIEARLLKGEVLSKQVQILTLIKPANLTPEFSKNFKNITKRVYSADLTKKELLWYSAQLDEILLSLKKI